jgi:stalled ribosome alternative rescue factor ArfA
MRKRRNHIAKDLRDARFRQRVARMKTKYTRKVKHKKGQDIET